MGNDACYQSAEVILVFRRCIDDITVSAVASEFPGHLSDISVIVVIGCRGDLV